MMDHKRDQDDGEEPQIMLTNATVK